MFALRLCIVAALLAVSGCDTVLIDSPIGEKLPRADTAKLMGRWTDDDQNIVELHLSKQGEVIFGVLSWDDQNQRFEAISKVLDVRTVDDSIYVFATEEEDASDGNAELEELESDNANQPAEKNSEPDEDKPQFIFFQVRVISDSEIHLFLPDPKAVRKAVGAGKLDGIVKERSRTTDVFIKASEEKSKAFIASKQWATLFQIEPTFKLKLIKKAT
jgi:hypothetical protein